jgi:hypothetical protein
MTDDEMLGRLRDAERGEDVLADPRWEAFARGEISPEEEHALRQLAARAGLGEDVFSALRPPEPASENDLVDLALRAVAAAFLPADQPTAGRQGS